MKYLFIAAIFFLHCQLQLCSHFFNGNTLTVLKRKINNRPGIHLPCIFRTHNCQTFKNIPAILRDVKKFPEHRHVSAKSGELLPLSRLRTVRVSFPTYSSSIPLSSVQMIPLSLSSLISLLTLAICFLSGSGPFLGSL